MQPLFQVHLHPGLTNKANFYGGTTGKQRFSCFPLHLNPLKELSLLTVFTSIFSQTCHCQAFLTPIGTIKPIHQMFLLSFCYWIFITFSPGVGNGTVLWYSCLENPMGRGSWWAIAHGIAQSQTWLNNWAYHIFNYYILGNPPKTLSLLSASTPWIISPNLVTLNTLKTCIYLWLPNSIYSLDLQSEPKTHIFKYLITSQDWLIGILNLIHSKPDLWFFTPNMCLLKLWLGMYKTQFS